MSDQTLDQTSDQITKAQTFKALHTPGEPIVLFNIWDPGSAQAVIKAGAIAVATGSHGVANAFGYEDGELIPLDIVLANAERVVAVSGDLPVTMDIETGYGETAADVQNSVARVLATGVVGVNLEDQSFTTGELRPLGEQVERIKAVRAAADAAGVPLFINARSDIFKNADPSSHASLVDAALERAQAYKDAGGDGFFVPGLADLSLITDLCQRSPLPVNIIILDGMDTTPQQLAAAGVARISHGPFPYLHMVAWLEAEAKKALI